MAGNKKQDAIKKAALALKGNKKYENPPSVFKKPQTDIRAMEARMQIESLININPEPITPPQPAQPPYEPQLTEHEELWLTPYQKAVRIAYLKRKHAYGK